MAAPKRSAAWGTRDAVLEDLRLARDAGGLAKAGADRLDASLRLRVGSSRPDDSQLREVRAWLAEYVTRVCAAYALAHRGDSAAEAAAASLEAILLQPRDSKATAASLRRVKLEQHSCFMAPDSLRKREDPILELVADAAHRGASTSGDHQDLFVSAEGILRVLAPYAEEAANAVARAAKLFSQRAALPDDSLLVSAIEDATWAIATLGVLPVYGLDRLRAIGVREFSEQSIEWLLEGIIRIPFVAEPDDLNQLSTAIRLGEEPHDFYTRLRRTPVMLALLERLIIWLAGHDPKVCLFDSNDVMVGYCQPHYYVALCQSVSYILEDWETGEFQQEAREFVSGLGLGVARLHRDS